MPTSHPPFEVIDHTADVGIIAYGRDFKELLENAALGMFSLMADLATVQPKERYEVMAEAIGGDEETLLLRWLQELHYLREAKGFQPCRATVTELTRVRVKGVAEGETLHKNIVLFHHIKAITRHLLQIERVNDLLRVQVVFDV